jgi:hypothetical protein
MKDLEREYENSVRNKYKKMSDERINNLWNDLNMKKLKTESRISKESDLCLEDWKVMKKKAVNEYLKRKIKK